MLHFPELHHFLAAFGSGQKMIKEAATWAASSRRTRRRCGLNMKGLWLLHASPVELIMFFDSLGADGVCVSSVICFSGVSCWPEKWRVNFKRPPVFALFFCSGVRIIVHVFGIFQNFP
jgi:hypothetical protein